MRWAPRVTALAFGAVLLLMAVAYVGESHADDTFIFMRYTQNVLRGEGVSFNPGEPTYGFTSALWLGVMAAVAQLFGNTLAVWKAASWLCYAVLSVMVARIALQSIAWPRAILLSTVVVFEPYLFRWSGTGMENPFAALLVFAVLVTWARLANERRQLVSLGVLLGLLPLVRPEFAILGGAIGIELLFDRRFRLADVAIVGVTAAAILAAGCGTLAALTGSWLPDTAAAKAMAAKQVIPRYGFRQTAIIIISGAGCAFVFAVGLLRERSARRLLRPALISLGCLWAYLSYQNQLVSTRYSVSLIFPLVSAVFLVAVTSAWRLRSIMMLSVGHLVAAIIVLIYLFPGTRTNEGRDIEAFAGQVRAATSETDHVALTEIGAFGFFSDRYVIDLVGLTDPVTVAWMRVHGPARDTAALEQLLVARGATYYVDSFGSDAPPAGRVLTFIPVLDHYVTRNNMSGPQRARWRLYQLVRRAAVTP